MKTSTWCLGVLLKFFVCMIFYTYGKNNTRPCDIRIPNNHTLFQNLLKYYDKDGPVLIVEYTLTFSNVSANFSLSRQSDPNAFEPWKWYSTQGIASSNLLLTYDFLYGAMKLVLSYCTEQEELILNVNPPDCLDTLEGGDLEHFIRNFLIKELTFGISQVKELFFCTTIIDEIDGYGSLLYRCWTVDSMQQDICYIWFKDENVYALHIFLIMVTIIVVIYFQIKMSDDYRYKTYEFTMPRNEEYIITLEVRRNGSNPPRTSMDQTSNSFPEDSSDGGESYYKATITSSRKDAKKLDIPFTTWKRLKLFDETKCRIKGTYEFKVEKLLLAIPFHKMFFGGETELGLLVFLSELTTACFNTLKTFKDYYDNIPHQHLTTQCIKGQKKEELGLNPPVGSNTITSKPCKNFKWRRIIELFFIKLFVLLLSLPISLLLCLHNTRFRNAIAEIKKRKLNIYWDMHFIAEYLEPSNAPIVMVVVYFFYFVHFFCLFFFRKKYHFFYKIISNKKVSTIEMIKIVAGEQQCTLNFYMMCSVFFMVIIFENVSLTFSVLNTLIVLHKVKEFEKGKCCLSMLCSVIVITYFATFFVLMLAVHFLIGLAVIAIIIITMEGGAVYNIICICLLLAAYIRISFQRVHKPFDAFMTTVLKTELSKDLFKDSRYQKDDSTSSKSYTRRHLKKPQFKICDFDLWVQLNDPLIDLNESNISQKFLLESALVDHLEAPGTVLHNFVKVMKQIMRAAFFLLFVFLVLMGYGNINHRSQDNVMFTTFLVSLIPILINHFVIKEGDKREGTDTSKKVLNEKIKETIHTFSEKWFVQDFIVKEIKKKRENFSEVNQEDERKESGLNLDEMSSTENTGNNESNDGEQKESLIWRLVKEKSVTSFYKKVMWIPQEVIVHQETDDTHAPVSAQGPSTELVGDAQFNSHVDSFELTVPKEIDNIHSKTSAPGSSTELGKDKNLPQIYSTFYDAAASASRHPSRTPLKRMSTPEQTEKKHAGKKSGRKVKEDEKSKLLENDALEMENYGCSKCEHTLLVPEKSKVGLSSPEDSVAGMEQGQGSTFMFS